MRIRIKDKDTNLRLLFPTGLVLNRLTVAILVWVMRDKDFPFTKKQLITLVKAAKAYKRRHPDWVLVEVDAADGDHVVVKL